MNLQRFRAQKVAVFQGLLLGFLIFLLNCVLVFVYMDETTHNLLSYIPILLILGFAGRTGYLRMKQTKNSSYAIQSSILTASIGLLLGFGSLFILTFSFIDVVRNNPLTLQNFQLSGQKNLDTFIRDTVIQATIASVPVSIILGIISGAFGALHYRTQIKR